MRRIGFREEIEGARKIAEIVIGLSKPERRQRPLAAAGRRPIVGAFQRFKLGIHGLVPLQRSQHEPGLCVVGLRADRRTEGVDRGLDVALFHQGDAQPVAELGVA